MQSQGRLIILRHAESVWNQKNIFTGWVNVPLSEEGTLHAIQTGKILSPIDFDIVYVSELIRSQMTALLALARGKKTPILMYEESPEFKGWHEIYSEKIKKEILPMIQTSALNERYYGELQGQNKEQIKQQYGEETFKKWRRSYDTPPPHGESLKMTIERTLPFFNQTIIPRLAKGETVLVCAHGNSIRGIIMEIEKLSPEEVVSLEIPTGEPMSYLYDKGKWTVEAL